MPYVLADLVVNRVDLVDEGANSAAFIEVFKRKEIAQQMEVSEILSKLKPEHAKAISDALKVSEDELAKARTDLDTANARITEQDAKLAETSEALAKAAADLEIAKAKDADEACSCDGEEDENGMCKACGKPKKKAAEADVLKGMPEAVKTEFLKMRAQKEAAEEQVRKAAEEKATAEAVAKAATLKALPVSQETLVDIIKNCDQSVVDVLQTVAAAIDSTVLTEVGKAGTVNTGDAWTRIEAEADKIASRDSITKQKAIGVAIKEHPDLYREYLNGGAQ